MRGNHGYELDRTRMMEIEILETAQILTPKNFVKF
jgi:hypothetical protein